MATIYVNKRIANNTELCKAKNDVVNELGMWE